MFCEFCETSMEESFVHCLECSVELDREEVIITKYFEKGYHYLKMSFIIRTQFLKLNSATLNLQHSPACVTSSGSLQDRDLVARGSWIGNPTYQSCHIHQCANCSYGPLTHSFELFSNNTRLGNKDPACHIPLPGHTTETLFL